MAVSTFNTSTFGANPFVIEGPVVTSPTGSGVILPSFKVGTLTWGDSGSEFIYCKLTLAGALTMTPGMWFQWDKDYNATALTTAAAIVGYDCGVFVGGNTPPTVVGAILLPVALAAGVYYVWMQRAGQAPAFVSATTLPALLIAETTAVAGQANVPASATVTTKQITPVSFQTANITFTATTVNASNTLTLLSGATVASGPFMGAILTGTGVAGLTVTGLTTLPNGVISSITMSGNASANGTAVTMTATGVLEASLKWPYIGKIN